MSPIEKRLQYVFKNETLLRQALTHKSFAHENKKPDFHNEKLEFLGDAVIDLALGEFLLELFPGDNEGALSKKRASLVNEESLARLSVAIGLPENLLLGKGETQTGGGGKPRLLASAWEALTGALFLDGGYDSTKEVLRREFMALIKELDPSQDYLSDYKTRVQESSQKVYRITPTYDLVSEDGPPHDRIFTVSLKLKEEEIARGSGRSKKIAEQQAAREALSNPRWQSATSNGMIQPVASAVTQNSGENQ